MIRRTRCAFLAKYDDEVNEKGGEGTPCDAYLKSACIYWYYVQ